MDATHSRCGEPFRDVSTSALLSRSNARSVPERSDQRGMWSNDALLTIDLNKVNVRVNDA